MTAGAQGVFTLSLDCEGLWGMADNRLVMTSGTINTTSLDDAYQFLDRVLADNGIRATAAFVSAFAAPREAVRAQLPEIGELARLCPDWYAHLLPRLREGTARALDGLEGHGFWSRLAKGGHEMGWHGATHLPLWDRTPPESVALELRVAEDLHAAMGHVPRSVVFPRNLAGNLSALRAAGFETFRDGARGEGLSARLAGLAREWNLLDRGESQAPRIENDCCLTTPGLFLNWPSGPRSLVPGEVTVMRWRHMLRTAAEEGRHLHMWFHPHNLVTAPAMRAVLARVLHEAGELVRAGSLANLTMGQLGERARAGR